MAWWNPLSRSGRKKTEKGPRSASKPKRKTGAKAAGARKAGAAARRKPKSPRVKAKKKGKPAGRLQPGDVASGTKVGVRGARKKQAMPPAAKTGASRKPAAAKKQAAAAEGTERVQLRWIAQARSGDKGDIANIALFAPTEEMYAHFCKEVTVARVKKHFGDFVKGKIDRYEAPNVRALNFVARAALGGGGASSLRSDPLGKSYGSNLLRMEIDVPADLLARTPRWEPPDTLPDV